MGSQHKNTSTRNKLFWYNKLDAPHAEKIESGQPLLDIGKELSLFIKNSEILKHLDLEVESFIKKLIKERAGNEKSLILENIGILLEPELGLNVEKILMDLSRELTITIKWPFEFEAPGTFYWDKSNRHIKLEFPELAIKQLEQ